VISPSSPSPTRKGKERALTIDEDTEMKDTSAGVEGKSESSQHPVFYYPLSPSTKSISAGKQPNISIDGLIVSSPSPLSDANTPPTEPRPPDPPDGGTNGDVMVDEAEERMPPKMRKKWMHRELESRKEPSTKVSQDGLGIIIDSRGASPSLLTSFLCTHFKF
jgi:hypothetical protein